MSEKEMSFDEQLQRLAFARDNLIVDKCPEIAKVIDKEILKVAAKLTPEHYVALGKLIPQGGLKLRTESTQL